MTVRINASSAGLTETVDTSGILEFQTANTSALVIDASQNANFTSTGAITVPVGTTAQRPTGVNGMIRYNTTTAAFEYFANNTWATANVTPPPVNTVAPVVSGDAVVDVTLSCTTGTWTNSPTSYAYQWRANSVTITNATSNTFTVTSAQLGANISCNVTAINLAGNATATSNSVGPVIALSMTYLVAAGGGGGGFSLGGGGGAGGYLSNTVSLTKNTQYTITVGAGGGGSGSGSVKGGNGSNSSISGTGLTTILSFGGGGGGSYNGSVNGASGGSGGGGAQQGSTGGAGTAGQGFAGGNRGVGPASAGGGGASAASDDFNGGNGAASTITGTSVYYCGGGGGAPNAIGGLGGGGNGGTRDTLGPGGYPGTAFTGGGGGGGGGGNSDNTGGNGGSGVVIISVPTATFSNVYTGSNVVVTTTGSNTVLKYSASGTYTA